MKAAASADEVLEERLLTVAETMERQRELVAARVICRASKAHMFRARDHRRRQQRQAAGAQLVRVARGFLGRVDVTRRRAATAAAAAAEEYDSAAKTTPRTAAEQRATPVREDDPQADVDDDTIGEQMHQLLSRISEQEASRGTTSPARTQDKRFIVASKGDADASTGCTVRVWDTQSWQTTVVLRVFSDGKLRCRFSKDARFIVSQSEDGIARVWDSKHNVWWRFAPTSVRRRGEAAAAAHGAQSSETASASGPHASGASRWARTRGILAWGSGMLGAGTPASEQKR